MNWERFNQEAYNLVEQQGKKQERQILSAYGQLLRDIENKIAELYAKFWDKRDTASFYNTLLQYNRLANLQEQIKNDIVKYKTKVNKMTYDYITMQFTNSYYYKQYALNWLVPDLTFGLIPDQLIEISVYSTAESIKNVAKSITRDYGDVVNYVSKVGDLKNIIARHWSDLLLKVQQELTIGITTGESYTKMATRLKKIIGKEYKKNGIVYADGFKAKMLRIARTEGNRVRNAGSFANSMRAKNIGIKLKKMYVATLDTRTRPQSASMDGQIVDIDEPFIYPNGAKAMYPGSSGVPEYDIHDRCTYIEIVEGYEPTTRMGRNPVTGENETFSYKNFKDWAEEKGLKVNDYGQVI